MPVSWDSNPAGHDHTHECIHIGLVNNMPDGALQATERQFLTLLNSAADDRMIRLSLFALPDLPRSGSGLRHIKRHYSSTEKLSDCRLDGLIVTGAEPRASNLKDEPYWESLTRVLDWAENNTRSSVWSCLAAHAALLHLDGIRRQRSNTKHFGIFECARVSNHRLTAGVPARFHMPHSRWNGILENDLTASGYSVLTRVVDAGVDIFARERKSLFVFFQGHPEYESDTLWLEYRREIGRYVRGEIDSYPSTPRSYFDPDTVAALTAIEDHSAPGGHKELLAQISTAAGKRKIVNTWSSAATCIYRNWLDYILTQKRACDGNEATSYTRPSGLAQTIG